MKKPGAKHLILFAFFVVKKIDALNLAFQAEDFELHQLHQLMCDGYRAILRLFIKPNVMEKTELHRIDPSDEYNIVPLSRIDLGGACESELLEDELSRNDAEILRAYAKRFLKDLASQL